MLHLAMNARMNSDFSANVERNRLLVTATDPIDALREITCPVGPERDV